MIPHYPILEFLRDVSAVLVGLPSIAVSLLVVIGIKSIIGYHFPWERCECCGKQWKHHDPEGENKCGKGCKE